MVKIRKERRFALVKRGESVMRARHEGRGGWITASGCRLGGSRGTVVAYLALVSRDGAEVDPFGEKLPVEVLTSTWLAPEVR